MIRLHQTTMKLEVALVAAVTTLQAQCAVSFYEVPPYQKSDFSEYRGVTQVQVTDNTNDVTLCEGPIVKGSVRNVDHICIFNRDSAAATVVIKIDDGGTETILVRKELSSKQSLVYEHGQGWQVI